MAHSRGIREVERKLTTAVCMPLNGLAEQRVEGTSHALELDPL